MTSDEQRAAPGPGAVPTNGITDPISHHPANGLTNGSANGATDPDRLDLLDRYWDATTGNGFQRAGAIALDPVRARTVDLLQTLTHDQTAGIPADARARIWRETVATAGIPTRQESPMTSSALPGSGATTPDLTLPASNPTRRRRSTPPGGPIQPGGRWTVPGGGGPSQPTGRTWWPRLQFAVAAALILGLFATILAPMDDGRVGLFGGIGSTPTADDQATDVGSNQFGESSGHQLVPTFDQGLDLRLYHLTLPAGASFDLPSEPAWPTGAVWQFQGFIGSVEFLGGEGSGTPYSIQPATSGGTANGGRLTNVSDADSQVWLYGLVPRGIELATGSNSVTLREVGRQDVSTLVPGSNVALSGAYHSATSEPRSLVAEDPPPEAGPQPLTASQTAGVIQAVQGRITIEGLPDGSGPATLTEGQGATFEDIGDATVIGETAPERDSSQSASYVVVTVQPYVFGEGGLTRTPNAVTNSGSAVNLPTSETGLTVSLDRVSLVGDSTLTLPAGSSYTTRWVSGQYTVTEPGGSGTPVDAPFGVDVGVGGGRILTVAGQAASVTILTVAPVGAPPLAPSDGVTVTPLSSFPVDDYASQTAANIMWIDGVAPVSPETIVTANEITGIPAVETTPRTRMVIFAEQSGIAITSPDQAAQAITAGVVDPENVVDLTVPSGGSAVIGNPVNATIAEATRAKRPATPPS